MYVKGFKEINDTKDQRGRLRRILYGKGRTDGLCLSLFAESEDQNQNKQYVLKQQLLKEQKDGVENRGKRIHKQTADPVDDHGRKLQKQTAASRDTGSGPEGVGNVKEGTKDKTECNSSPSGKNGAAQIVDQIEEGIADGGVVLCRGVDHIAKS